MMPAFPAFLLLARVDRAARSRRPRAAGAASTSRSRRRRLTIAVRCRWRWSSRSSRSPSSPRCRPLHDGGRRRYSSTSVSIPVSANSVYVPTASRSRRYADCLEGPAVTRGAKVFYRIFARQGRMWRLAAAAGSNNAADDCRLATEAVGGSPRRRRSSTTLPPGHVDLPGRRLGQLAGRPEARRRLRRQPPVTASRP